MWKNDFNFDLFTKNKTYHIGSLVKWGGSYYEERKRIFPSGIPKISKKKFYGFDPTWKLEHEYFFNLIKKKDFSSLEKDILINNLISDLQSQIV